MFCSTIVHSSKWCIQHISYHRFHLWKLVNYCTAQPKYPVFKICSVLQFSRVTKCNIPTFIVFFVLSFERKYLIHAVRGKTSNQWRRKHTINQERTEYYLTWLNLINSARWVTPLLSCLPWSCPLRWSRSPAGRCGAWCWTWRWRAGPRRPDIARIQPPA